MTSYLGEVPISTVAMISTVEGAASLDMAPTYIEWRRGTEPAARAAMRVGALARETNDPTELFQSNIWKFHTKFAALFTRLDGLVQRVAWANSQHERTIGSFLTLALLITSVFVALVLGLIASTNSDGGVPDWVNLPPGVLLILMSLWSVGRVARSVLEFRTTVEEHITREIEQERVAAAKREENAEAS